MEIITIHPHGNDIVSGQHDAFNKVHTAHDRILDMNTFISGPPGIGKSRMMADLAASAHTKHHAVVFIIAPNNGLADQLVTKEIAPWLRENRYPVEIVDLKNYEDLDTISADIQKGHEEGRFMLISLSHLCHTKGKWSKATSFALSLIEILSRKRIAQYTIIDEIQLNLTSLTGGINSCINIHKEVMRSYGKILFQSRTGNSLNMFEHFQKCGVKFAAFSGTLNDIVMSKRPSMGYMDDALLIVNIAPFPALYNSQDFIPIDTNKITATADIRKRIEESGGVIMDIFSSREDIKRHDEMYTEHFGYAPPNSVTIVSDNNETQKLGSSTQNIRGVNLITTGFNTASTVGQNLSAVFLHRTFSNKGLYPLSNNPEHDLHCDFSGAFIQAAARGRGGSCQVYIPEMYGSGINLYTMTMCIHRILSDTVSRSPYDNILPQSTQADKIHQGIMVALRQSLRAIGKKQTRVVGSHLANLWKQTGRMFLEESATPEFDNAYWTQQIGILWEVYYKEICPDECAKYEEQVTELEEKAKGEARKAADVRLAASNATVLAELRERTESTRAVATAAAIQMRSEPHSNTVKRAMAIAKEAEELENNILSTGKGYCKGRIIDLQEKIAVISRAGGRCDICGSLAMPGRQMNIGHVRSHEYGGLFMRDNLVWDCPSCDAMFDDGKFIIDIVSGIWQDRTIRFVPNPHLRSFLSASNIENRWNQHKNKLCPVGDFHATLVANGMRHET